MSGGFVIKWLRKIDQGIAMVEKTILTLAFSTLILGLFGNIVSRNLFGKSYQVILEMAPLLVVWVTFLGATLAFRERRHIKLDVFLRYVPAPWKRVSQNLGYLFGMLVMAILLYSSGAFLENEYDMFGVKGLSSGIFGFFFLVSFFRYFILLFEDSP